MRLTAVTDSVAGLIVPLLLWGAHLVFVYGLLAVDCAVIPGAGAATLPVLWLASFAAAIALGSLAGVQYRHLRQGRDRGPGEPWGVHSLVLKAGPLISLIALVAVVWTALPLVFVTPCA